MPLKILLADDNMTAQNTGRRILSDAGYTVVAVSNGAAALKKYASEHPDLLVLDVFMPGYSGLEVCEKLKAEASVPVLLTFSRMEPFRPEDGERVGADGSIAKPFDSAELLATVERLLGGPAKTEESAAPATVASMGHSEFKQAIARSPHAISAAEEAPLAPARAAHQDEQAAHRDEMEKPGPQVPFVDLSAVPESDPEHDDSAVELQPAVAAALASTEDPAENGFFAFRSNTFFTASSVDREAAAHSQAPIPDPPEPAQAEPAAKGFSESFFGSTFSKSEAERPSPQLVPQPAEEIAPEASAAPATDNAVEGWWSAQTSDAETNEPGLALQPAGESPALANIAPTFEQPSSSADQSGDIHSMLAQLLPSVPETSPEITFDSQPEVSAAESFASELKPDFEVHRESVSLVASEPKDDNEDAIKELSAQSSGKNEPPASDPQAQWNSSLVSSMVELNDHDRDAEPSVALETVPAPPANGSSSHSNGTSPARSASNSEVTDAVERVLARFRESLLSEVMRELSPK